MKRKTVGQMIALIRRKKCIYDIHFCRAGVGFVFYDPPVKMTQSDNWEKYLKVERYYPNITKATVAEYKKLFPFVKKKREVEEGGNRMKKIKNLPNSLVTVDPDILHGTPVFFGTRVPIYAVLKRIAYGWTVDEISRSFPDVKKKTISALILAIKEEKNGS